MLYAFVGLRGEVKVVAWRLLGDGELGSHFQPISQSTRGPREILSSLGGSG